MRLTKTLLVVATVTRGNQQVSTHTYHSREKEPGYKATDWRTSGVSLDLSQHQMLWEGGRDVQLTQQLSNKMVHLRQHTYIYVSIRDFTNTSLRLFCIKLSRTAKMFTITHFMHIHSHKELNFQFLLMAFLEELPQQVETFDIQSFLDFLKMPTFYSTWSHDNRNSPCIF